MSAMEIFQKKNTVHVSFGNLGTMKLTKVSKKLTSSQINKTIERIEKQKNKIINSHQNQFGKELHDKLEIIVSNLLLLIITDSSKDIIALLYKDLMSNIIINKQDFQTLFNNSYNYLYQNLVK